MKILTKWKNYKDNKIREKEQNLMKKLTTGNNHNHAVDESNSVKQDKIKAVPVAVNDSLDSEQKGSQREYSGSNSRGVGESLNNSKRGEKKRVARKKRYNPNRAEEEEQWKRASVKDSSEEMDDEPHGLTERDPVSSRNRNKHLQNNSGMKRGNFNGS